MCSDGSFVYVVDAGSRKIRRIDPVNATVTTVAGSGASPQIVDGIGSEANFMGLNHIASDGTYLYLTDSNTLRRVDPATGQVVTLFTLPSTGVGGLVKVGEAIYVVDSSRRVYKVY